MHMAYGEKFWSSFFKSFVHFADHEYISNNWSNQFYFKRKTSIWHKVKEMNENVTEIKGGGVSNIIFTLPV